MPPKDPLQNLRASIDVERLANLNRLKTLKALSDSMMAYQNGTGPPPTTEDFEAWRAQVAEAIRLREAGLTWYIGEADSCVFEVKGCVLARHSNILCLSFE